MFQNYNTRVAVNSTTALITALIIVRLNSGIKDFFMDQFLMFIVFTLYLFQTNDNIILSMATSFALVVIATAITTENYMQEAFDIIYGGPNTKPGCENIKVADLVALFGTEEKLKEQMEYSGVPYNLYLNDQNVPEIATYLINAGHKVSETCNM